MQAQWHFDFVHGNDTNNGLTAATALKTWKEYTKRTGTLPRIEHRVDYYVHGDMGHEDSLVLVGLLTGGAQYVHFVPTAAQILHTGTLTGVVHYDNVTRVREEIQETGFDFSPFVGALVKVTTGAANANYMHILAAPDVGRAIVGYVGTVDPTDPFLSYLYGTNVVGDAYQIIQRPKVFNFFENSDGAPYMPGGVQAAPILIECADFSQCAPAVIGRRELSSIVVLNSCNLSNVELHDSAASNGCIVVDGGAFVIGRVVATFFDFLRASLYCDGSMEFFGAVFESCTDAIVFSSLASDAPTSWVQSHHGAYGIAIFNCTRWGVFDEGATLLLEAGLWGEGNHGLVVSFSDAGRCLIDNNALTGNPFNVLTDVSPEMTLDGYTALPAIDPVTFAQTPDLRATTFANWNAAVSAGGFGRRMSDPTCRATCVMNTPA